MSGGSNIYRPKYFMDEDVVLGMRRDISHFSMPQFSSAPPNQITLVINFLLNLKCVSQQCKSL